MGRFRFSLLGLGGLVTLIALGCAAVVYANTWVSAAVWWATFLILMVATLAALVRQSPERAWWIGFSLFGWLFVLSIYGPFSGLNRDLQSDVILQKVALAMPQATVTHESIDHYGIAGYETGMEGGMDAGMGAEGSEGMLGMGASAPVTFQSVDGEYLSAFIRVSRGLLTLLLACLGGFCGRLIESRNRRVEKGA
jgi:hypothetical protein